MSITVASGSTPQLDEIITEDGILCSILSSLTLREAVASAVLSLRWRHLWNYLPKLHFCAKNLFDAHTVSLIYSKDTPLSQEEIIELMMGKTDQFIQSVDSVLQQHQGGAVEEFRVRYHLSKAHSHHLDAWIRFAVSAKTKLLGLHLHRPYEKEFEGEKYDFPFQLLGSTSFLEELILVSCSLRLPCKINGLSRLKVLKLFSVDLSEEDVIRLLSTCSTLEHLTLQAFPQLVTLRIPYPLNELQHLVVRNCDQLREIKMNAVNLSKLEYWGFPVDFIFRQSPELKVADILFKPDVSEPNMDFYLRKLSSNLPHVQSLAFHLWGVTKVPDFPKGSSRFSHLTRLDWCWNTSVKMSILHLSTLLDASPFLKEFYLRLWTPGTVEQPPERLNKIRRMLPKHPHTHLKTVRLLDFYCDKWHMEFALYLLKNAIELESMMIEKGRRGLDEAHIRNLRREVPANVKIVIL